MADGGEAQMDEMIARLRRLPDAFREQAPPRVARAFERRLHQNIAKGVGPDGKPWKLTKDGRRPLERAARAVKVAARGTVVLATVTGHHARHHLGAVKGKVKREIIPRFGVPDLFAGVIKDVLDDVFRETMGAGHV